MGGCAAEELVLPAQARCLSGTTSPSLVRSSEEAKRACGFVYVLRCELGPFSRYSPPEGSQAVLVSERLSSASLSMRTLSVREVAFRGPQTPFDPHAKYAKSPTTSAVVKEVHEATKFCTVRTMALLCGPWLEPGPS